MYFFIKTARRPISLLRGTTITVFPHGQKQRSSKLHVNKNPDFIWNQAFCKTYKFILNQAFLSFRYLKAPSAANPDPSRRTLAGSGRLAAVPDPSRMAGKLNVPNRVG